MESLIELNVVNLGKLFCQLAESSQDVFWISCPDYTTLLYVSPAYEKIWGQSCESLYKDGRSWFANAHPEDYPKIELNINQITKESQEGQSYFFEYRIIRSDNGIRRIREVNFPLYDSDHKLIGFAGIAKDVTAETERLAELEQASYFFRFFADKIKAVFWVRDNTCERQLYVSPGYEKIWRRSCESLYKDPTSWLNTLHPDDWLVTSNAARLRTLDKVGPEAQYEEKYRIYLPTGELRWIKDVSFPIQNEKNQFIGFAGIAEDITKEVLHEKELREAIQRAEVANQAKSDFLAMISHELRTPLNAILGMAQILQKKELPSECNEYVNIISDAGNNLLALVSDILDFARLEVGKLSFASEPIDIPDLFNQIVQNLQYQLRDKEVTLHLECAPLLPPVMGDSNRLRQVLVNLLSNAIKFTDKGHIKVIVNCINKTVERATFEVSVIDTGIGIHADKLDTIFEKFSQIDSIYHRKHSGIGLGLSITKQLINSMSGQIKVKSELGSGSEFRFTVSLDLQELAFQMETNNKNRVTSPLVLTQYKLNILLVEDNLINQKIAKVMLEDFGCSVDVVNNGQEVVNRIPQLFKYDLIFMDIGLPDMSGFDIVRKLRMEVALMHIPIVAMTAHILEHDREQATDVGMNQMIAKPISYDEIDKVLRMYCKTPAF